MSQDGLNCRKELVVQGHQVSSSGFAYVTAMFLHDSVACMILEVFFHASATHHMPAILVGFGCRMMSPPNKACGNSSGHGHVQMCRDFVVGCRLEVLFF